MEVKLRNHYTSFVLVALSHHRMIDSFFRSYFIFFFLFSLFFSLVICTSLGAISWPASFSRDQSIAFQRRQICEVYHTLSYNDNDIQERCHLIHRSENREDRPREMTFIELALFDRHNFTRGSRNG